jgi:pimeloyl-ACP methyl ester carboxylesterase
MGQDTTETPPRRPLTPVSTGHADVNGITLYHEIYGQGEPLVLLHGGLMTIGEMSVPLQFFAKTRRVIAVELQGHGRTPDADRPLSFEAMGDDIAALLDHLNIAQADVVGLSLGAAVGLRTAIQHPDKVRRLVIISNPFAKSGWYLEAQKGMGQISAAMAEHLMQTPTGHFSTQWLEPRRFPRFLDKLGKMLGASYDWSDDVKQLSMPVMLVFADNDSVSQKTHRGVFRAARRRREGARLAEHQALEGAARDRSWLQPLQLRERTGTCADHQQIPRRSVESPLRRSGRSVPRCVRTDLVQLGKSSWNPGRWADEYRVDPHKH